MCFSLLHYTSKNEKKYHECCQKEFLKKKHSKLPIEKNKEISKDGCNKKFKNKKSKKLQPKKWLLYKYVILGSYIKKFELE
jgi:hypothetical protein